MAIVYAYEPEYRYAGWFDGETRTVPSWFDRDLVEDVPKKLAVLGVDFFLDADAFYGWTVTVTVYHSQLFLDDDLIFHPTALRKLSPPDRYLKNEVIRVR